MIWRPVPERDNLGYRVYRVADDGTEVLVCDNPQGKTDCTDTDNHPPAEMLTYRVYALDRENLADPNSALRRGAYAERSVGPAGTRPPAPQDLRLNGSRLEWTQPAGGTVIFYRIYRDKGTDLMDRWDRTTTADPYYTDPIPGNTTAHRYWVTAVDEGFNESLPSEPFNTP